MKTNTITTIIIIVVVVMAGVLYGISNPAIAPSFPADIQNNSGSESTTTSPSAAQNPPQLTAPASPTGSIKHESATPQRV